MITTLDCLKANYNYSQDNCYLVFIHQVKPRHKEKIKADWFDFNYGGKVLWLLVRELSDDEFMKPKYRRIKFKNIKPEVEIVRKDSVL
ncbi:DUF5513 family protein [Aeribacillus sp. FSL K6-1121]|uniref:DUF5513 family protein n=1 Tax=Aeribacillus sp. FSL K6-1121 TaxID=2954745 RepID=UPI0030FBB6DD